MLCKICNKEIIEPIEVTPDFIVCSKRCENTLIAQSEAMDYYSKQLGNNLLDILKPYLLPILKFVNRIFSKKD